MHAVPTLKRWANNLSAYGALDGDATTGFRLPKGVPDKSGYRKPASVQQREELHSEAGFEIKISVSGRGRARTSIHLRSRKWCRGPRCSRDRRTDKCAR